MTARYGLPETVTFCRRCVISNQRPNSAVETQHTHKSKKGTIHFDAEGICDACRVAEAKQHIDWSARRKELVELLDLHRKPDGAGYDVIVPGSGGKDSFYAAHRLKYEFGMHPLTVTWAPHIYTDWGRRNFDAWIQSGLDNVLFTPNGKVHRLLTRLAVENLFHPFQPFMLGQKHLPPRLAAQFNIPLVFYGENEAEYGNPKEDADKAERDWAYWAADDRTIYLGGDSVADLKQRYGLKPVDLAPYMPLHPETARDRRIEVRYLGYYLKWHPQSAYYYASEHGFRAAPERTPGTYSKYNSIDDKMDDFHYYTTFIKFGIGRATYDAAQEVRSGDITREEAAALVRRFDGEYPSRFESEVFEYLSVDGWPPMTRERFSRLSDDFRSLHLWDAGPYGWSLRHQVDGGRLASEYRAA